MTDGLMSEIETIKTQCEALSLFVVSGDFERGNTLVVHWEADESSRLKPFLEGAKRLGARRMGDDEGRANWLAPRGTNSLPRN